jgi:hypothetical protein
MPGVSSGVEGSGQTQACTTNGEGEVSPKVFEQANAVLGAPANTNGRNVEGLAVYTDGEQCISCWKLSWRERLSALFFGKAWLYVLGGRTQPPISIEVRHTIFPTSE